MFNYEQLIKSVFALFEDDFYNLYVNLEERNGRENTNYEPWTYRYDFPRKNAHFVTECNENGNVKFYLSIEGKIYTLGGKEHSPRDLFKEADTFHEIMSKYHLNFCPKHNKEFANLIKSAEKGTVISLNTGRMISCVDKKGDTLLFKECFSGKLEDLKIESFQNGKTFSVNINNYDDIQDIFEHAYNTRSLTANLRVSINSKHGAYEVTDVEQKLSQNETLKVHVGPINLKISDFNGKKFWFDSNNKQIDRETIETLFGWASLTLPEIKIDRPEMFLPEKMQNASFVQDIQNLIKEKRFDMIPSAAFSYSENNRVPTFLNITGFERQQNGSYDMTTFAFKDNRIIKIVYSFNEKLSEPIPVETKEINDKEFICFCKQKYDDTIHFLKTEYTPLVEKYKLDYGNNTPTKVLLSKTVDFHMRNNPPLVPNDAINNVTNLVKVLVNDSIENYKTSKLNASDLLEDIELPDKE